jgi:hypothetical protein
MSINETPLRGLFASFRIDTLRWTFLEASRLADCSPETNRELAAALFLRERTVESHIAAIFAKLGVRSRTEIVATLLGR